MLGRDSTREAYRVATSGSDGRIVGLVPDTLISSGPVTGGHGHQTAYEWLANHSKDIETALHGLSEGRPPRAPFDRIVLEKDA
ncbi:MAG: hypothetical protein AAGA87_10495 [Pseudomonadota bacterium]